MVSLVSIVDNALRAFQHNGLACVVGVSDAAGTFRTSVRAVVLNVESVGVLTDYESQPNVETKRLVFSMRGEGGWNMTRDPQIGDVVTLDDGRRFSVTNVRRSFDALYSVEVAQC